MARVVMLEAQLSLGGQDVTDWVSKVEFEYQFAEVDVTTMGDGGAKTLVGGLEEGSLAIDFKNDYAVSALNSIMVGLVSRTPVAFTVRQNSAVVSSTNPQWSGSVLINSWQPIAGNVGDAAATSRTYSKSGTFTYSTST